MQGINILLLELHDLWYSDIYRNLWEDSLMDERKKITVGKTVKTGISFGSALAMVISYSTWHSVGWAVFHGLLSWVYVIYFILRY